MKSMTIIKIEAGPSEPALSVLKKFSRRVNESGVLRRARSHRFALRPQSDKSKKKSALHKISQRAERQKLLKLGKIKDGIFTKPHQK